MRRQHGIEEEEGHRSMQKAPFVYVREACSYTFGTTTASKHTSPLSFSICIFYFSKRRAVFLPLCPNQIIPVRPPGAALLTPGGLRVMTAPDDGSHHNFSTCFTSLSQKNSTRTAPQYVCKVCRSSSSTATRSLSLGSAAVANG